MSASKKRGRGRPAKPAEERALSVTVRLDPDDRDNLEEIKEELDCSTTDAIKDALESRARVARNRKARK